MRQSRFHCYLRPPINDVSDNTNHHHLGCCCHHNDNTTRVDTSSTPPPPPHLCHSTIPSLPSDARYHSSSPAAPLLRYTHQPRPNLCSGATIICAGTQAFHGPRPSYSPFILTQISEIPSPTPWVMDLPLHRHPNIGDGVRRFIQEEKKQSSETECA